MRQNVQMRYLYQSENNMKSRQFLCYANQETCVNIINEINHSKNPDEYSMTRVWWPQIFYFNSKNLLLGLQ